MTHIALLIFGAIIFINIGAVLGFGLSAAFRHQRIYAGVIKISKEEDKVLYSLELQDNPELLEQNDEIIFKVITSS